MTARSIDSRRHIRTDTRLSNGRGDGISGRDGRRARSRVSARPRPVCLYQRRSWTPRQPSRSVAAGPDATPGRRRGRAGAPGAAASNHWGGGDVSRAGAPGAAGDRGVRCPDADGVACLRRVRCPRMLPVRADSVAVRFLRARGPCRRDPIRARPATTLPPRQLRWPGWAAGAPAAAGWEDAVAM
ncbi:hypothetical protein GQ55_6G252700 [Panicum hallii var. hallii]|uniref:Uncharacterized protein n=1 Tax=Panicum hallii var. hallii TaxID=1504633 RepID=A0A2T7D9L3_9POAL|nr:hypothetical protein GQ55_6G252700 [Panicum hallii var. hallii]